MERLPDKLNNQIFQKLKSIVEVERMTTDERFEYELSLSVERDLSAALETSFEDGEAKGMEKGKAEGLRLTAVNLKKQGVAPHIIATCTGLTLDEIEQL